MSKPLKHWNYSLGASESRSYSSRLIRGVHRPRMPYPGIKNSFGESSMGYQIKGMQTPGPCGAEYHWFTAIRSHVEVIAEAALIKPKLKGI